MIDQIKSGGDEREQVARIISLAKGQPETGQTSIGAWWWDARHDRARPWHFEGERREEDRKHADLMIPLLRGALDSDTAIVLIRRYHDATTARNDCPECENEGPWEHCGPCSERIGPILGAQINYLSLTPAKAGEDGVREALRRARDRAMRMTVQARVPECGEFGAIAQDLDFALSSIEEPRG